MEEGTIVPIPLTVVVDPFAKLTVGRLLCVCVSVCKGKPWCNGKVTPL